MPKHTFSRHDVVLIDGKPGAIKLVDECNYAVDHNGNPINNGVKVEMFDDSLPERERYFWIAMDDARVEHTGMTVNQWIVEEKRLCTKS